MSQVRFAFTLGVALILMQLSALAWVYWGFAGTMSAEQRVYTLLTILPITAASASVFLKNLAIRMRSSYTPEAPNVNSQFLIVAFIVFAALALFLFAGLIGYSLKIIATASELQIYIAVVQVVVGILFGTVLDEAFRF